MGKMSAQTKKKKKGTEKALKNAAFLLFKPEQTKKIVPPPSQQPPRPRNARNHWGAQKKRAHFFVATTTIGILRFFFSFFRRWWERKICGRLYPFLSPPIRLRPRTPKFEIAPPLRFLSLALPRFHPLKKFSVYFFTFFSGCFFDDCPSSSTSHPKIGTEVHSFIFFLIAQFFHPLPNL